MPKKPHVLKATRALPKTIDVKVFQTDAGTQLVVVLAQRSPKGKVEQFVMTPDVAAQFGHKMLTTAERTHQWNTCHLTGVKH